MITKLVSWLNHNRQADFRYASQSLASENLTDPAKCIHYLQIRLWVFSHQGRRTDMRSAVWRQSTVKTEPAFAYHSYILRETTNLTRSIDHHQRASSSRIVKKHISYPRVQYSAYLSLSIYSNIRVCVWHDYKVVNETMTASPLEASLDLIKSDLVVRFGLVEIVTLLVITDGTSWPYIWRKGRNIWKHTQVTEYVWLCGVHKHSLTHSISGNFSLVAAPIARFIR